MEGFFKDDAETVLLKHSNFRFQRVRLILLKNQTVLVGHDGASLLAPCTDIVTFPFEFLGNLLVEGGTTKCRVEPRQGGARAIESGVEEFVELVAFQADRVLAPASVRSHEHVIFRFKAAYDSVCSDSSRSRNTALLGS